MDNVSGDLFAGEAKLFFSNPRRKWKTPIRIETSVSVENHTDRPTSFNVYVANTNMIVLCDSRLDAVRVVKELCATDIGADTEVQAHDPDNVGRWSNAHTTSDGRHWSDGEYNGKRVLDFTLGSCFPYEDRRKDSAFNFLTAQLPPTSAEAVRDGHAVVISRIKNISEYLSTPRNRGGERYTLCVRRVLKAYGNIVYALRRVGSEDSGSASSTSNEVFAILVVGRFWPKETDASRENINMSRPTLTVARRRPTKGTTGGRVFCVSLGTHITGSLEGVNAEDIAKTKRHYEGYFSDDTYDSLLAKDRIL